VHEIRTNSASPHLLLSQLKVLLGGHQVPAERVGAVLKDLPHLVLSQGVPRVG
jgi:hypothetical protein